MDESARWAAQRQATGLPPIQVLGAAAGGRVIYGTVGDSDRLEMTMIGDAVNLAAKLEKHARTEARTALVSVDMYALAERQRLQSAGLVEHLPARAVEGVSRPIDLVALSA
jgi:adenylate cyclase